MSPDPLTLSAAWTALGTAVVQFLWQGTAVGLAAWALLGLLRERSSAARYTVCCGALLTCLIVFAWTLLSATRSAGAFDASALGALPRPALVAAGAAGPSAAANLAAWGWTLGALFMAARFLVQARGARRLRTVEVTPAEPRWGATLEALATELGIERSVRLLRSGLAEAPMVVGWMSPVVLVPGSAFTALSAGELRSLLIHELAHIRRHDPLVNAVQALIEIVLFFHPVVWWISKQARVEREYCCDDSSVRLTGNARLHAEALASMEALRITHSQTVLASNGGPLMQRITRILDGQQARRSASIGWQLPAGLLLAGVLATVGTATAAPGTGEQELARKLELERQAQTKRSAESTHEERIAEVEAALRSGELSHGVAAAKLEALEAREAYVQSAARIKAAIGSGELTKAEGQRALAESGARLKHAGVQVELRAAVEAGVLTEAQAEQKLGELRLRLAYVTEAARVKAAVEAGSMSKEEAGQALAGLAADLGMKQRVTGRALTTEQALERIGAHLRDREAKRAQGEAPDQRVAYAALEARVQAAVKAGELSEVEAKLKLLQARERRLQLDAAHAIQAAIKAGKLTPEQGKAKLAELERDLGSLQQAEQARALKTKYGAVKAKLAGLVEAGTLSEAEAERQLAGLMKRLESMHRDDAQSGKQRIEKQKPH